MLGALDVVLEDDGILLIFQIKVKYVFLESFFIMPKVLMYYLPKLVDIL